MFVFGLNWGVNQFLQFRLHTSKNSVVMGTPSKAPFPRTRALGKREADLFLLSSHILGPF